MSARIVLSPEFTDLVFEWVGGPYVEVYFSDPTHQDHTGQVINVWDYAKGKPRIPFTPAALERVVKAWVKDLEF